MRMRSYAGVPRRGCEKFPVGNHHPNEILKFQQYQKGLNGADMDVVEMFQDGLRLNSWLAVLVVLLLGLSLFLQLQSRLRQKTVSSRSPLGEAESVSYTARKQLLTPTETVFYNSLRLAVPDLKVFAKVRLEDLVAAEASRDFGARTSARNRIKSRHADFVLCNPQDFRILCAIELDDSSHQTRNARRNDAVKDEIFRQAGLPLVRFRARASYDPQVLVQRLQKVAGIEAEKPPAAPASRDMPIIDWDSHGPLPIRKE